MKMSLRRIEALILVLFMLLFAVPLTNTSAESVTADGFGYEIINGEAVITSYSGSHTEIVIPSQIDGFPVTVIGDCAFMNRSGIRSVKIPEGVTKIGYCAFENCINLTPVNIPSSVESIVRGSDYFDAGTWYNRAFYNTAYYNNEDNWENGLLYIDNALIAAKEDISGVCRIKEGTTLIADWTFFNCQELTRLEIPSSVTRIGAYAFASCGLPWVFIPLSVERVDCAFHHFFSDVYYEGSKEQWENIFNDAICEDCWVYVTCNVSRSDLPAASDTYILGDVNLNGRVNIVDVTMIQKSVAGLVILTEKEKLSADTNLDEKVNVKDATAIQKFSAGLETGYPIGQERKK